MIDLHCIIIYRLSIGGDGNSLCIMTDDSSIQLVEESNKSYSCRVVDITKSDY